MTNWSDSPARPVGDGVGDGATVGRFRDLLGIGVLLIAALAILIGLGNWQLDRLAWKTELIARMVERARAEPVPIESLRFAPEEDLEFTRVRLRGAYEHDRELHLVSPSSEGLGWTVITPFRTGEGAAPWLAMRGFVPDRLKDPAARPAAQIAGELKLTGRLRRPEERSWFTPDDDPAKNVWLVRDLPRMSEAAGASGRPPQPYFVEVDADPPPGGFPRPKPATPAGISNPHLQYALTWYGLALCLIGVFAAFAWSRLRRA